MQTTVDADVWCKDTQTHSFHHTHTHTHTLQLNLHLFRTMNMHVFECVRASRARTCVVNVQHGRTDASRSREVVERRVAGGGAGCLVGGNFGVIRERAKRNGTRTQTGTNSRRDRTAGHNRTRHTKLPRRQRRRLNYTDGTKLNECRAKRLRPHRHVARCVLCGARCALLMLLTHTHAHARMRVSVRCARGRRDQCGMRRACGACCDFGGR